MQPSVLLTLHTVHGRGRTDTALKLIADQTITLFIYFVLFLYHRLPLYTSTIYFEPLRSHAGPTIAVDIFYVHTT